MVPFRCIPWLTRLLPAFLAGVALTAQAADLVIQRGPQFEVDSAAYSPDGRVIASSGESETIHLWDHETGDLLATLPGHPERVFGVAFSPNGKFLASSSTDGSVKLWDFTARKLLFTFTNHVGNWARRVAFSPDSRLLAPAAYDGKISLWDTATGQIVRSLPMQGKVTEVLFTPDGHWLVTSLRDKEHPLIQFWNLSNGAPGLTLTASDSIHEIALSADGSRLAASCANARADVWQLPSGKLLREFQLPEQAPGIAIDISPNGRQIAVGQHLLNTLWSVDTGKLLCEMRGHDDDTFQIRFAPDGNEIVSVSADASLRLWDAATGKLKRVIPPHPPEHPVTSIAYSPDGAFESVGGIDGVIRVWDAETGAFKYELHGHEGPIHVLAFSPDSAWLCSGSADRTMRVWDMAHGTISAMHPYFERSESVGTEAFGGTENLIASASGPWGDTSLEPTIKLWQTHFDRPIRILRGHVARINALDFARGLDLLVSASADNTTKLWNTREGRCVCTVTNDTPVETLAFTPDSHSVVAGMADGTLRILSTNHLTVTRTWPAHHRAVHTLAFSADGHWLATAGDDQTVALWTWPDGHEIKRFTGVTSQYLPLAFHPKQPLLAFAQNDRVVVHVNTGTGQTVFQREFFPDGEWLAWRPDQPFYLASEHGDVHARLRFPGQLTPVYPLALYRGELSRPTNFLAAIAGPAPELAPKNFQLWWYRYPYKLAWLYGAAAAFFLWIGVYLQRGWLAERRRRAQENISRQLLASQEAERKRIAAELHDSLGQNLLIIKNRLHLAKTASPNADPAGQFQAIEQTVAQTIAEVREISYNLRPYQLDRLGLTKAVQSVVKRVSDSGFVKIENDLANIDHLFVPEQEINFYRIVQEGLNNIIKHSDAAWARISIRRHPGGLQMRIEDDGRGFHFKPSAGHAQFSRGFGLTSLGERVRILGGTFSCDSAPGKGTRLTFEIPITAPTPHAKNNS